MELRDEYQKEVKMEISDGPDYECTWPIDEKQNELSKKFVISLMKGKKRLSSHIFCDVVYGFNIYIGSGSAR